jgi:probable HAF family extracellular repeat protein
MQSHTRTWMAASYLSVMLTICISLTAQNASPANPPKYIAIEMRPLGGRQSNFSPFSHVLSNQEALAGSGDTADFDPNFHNQNVLTGENIFVQHAAMLRHGITTDLGALPGALNNSMAIAINNNATAVGLSADGSMDPILGTPAAVAVIWKNGQITNLGTFGGHESVAFAVNSSDQVTGCAANNIPDPDGLWGVQNRAFLYQNGMLTDIGTLGGTDACGTYINDAGQIVGISFTANNDFHTFIYANQQMTDIGTLGGTFTSPNWVNASGQIVGVSNLTGDSIGHAFFWDGAAIHDLGSLSSSFGSNYSEALSVNDAGDAVGYSLASVTAYHATYWHNGTITDLGTLPGDTVSKAWGINNRGQIVGTSGTAGIEAQHAVLWQNGQIYDLSHLSHTTMITAAFNINDQGEIAAVANANGDGNGGQQFYSIIQRSFLLVPFLPGGSNDGAQERETPAPKAGASHSLFGPGSHSHQRPLSLFR